VEVNTEKLDAAIAALNARIETVSAKCDGIVTRSPDTAALDALQTRLREELQALDDKFDVKLSGSETRASNLQTAVQKLQSTLEISVH
jgi:hypothetical protein